MMSRVFLFCLIFLSGVFSVQASIAEHADQNYEPAVLAIVDKISEGQLDTALAMVEKHLEDYPLSRVGHLLKADILTAMAAPVNDIGAGQISQSELVSGLKHQIKNRWMHAKVDGDKAHDLVPASLIDMGRHQHVLVADMQAGRLYLYRNQNNQPNLVKDYYMSVGSQGFGKEVEGDNKTPIGVYSIYRHIPGKELPDLYGKGAYPVNYPNRLDRAKKRTGYGIWLHGTPSNTYARSPWASEGCFVVSNDDLLDVEQYIDVKAKTPVILSDGIDWISRQELAQRRDAVHATISKWKRDWESLNTDAYLSHYSQEDFDLGRGGFRQWADRKRQVNKGKTFVQVDVEIQDLFMYPGEQDLFVVNYTQRYLSNNYSGQANKEQYWRRGADGQWRIIYEG